MTSIMKVISMDEVHFSSRWKSSAVFYSHGKFLNKKNEYVKASYPGARYELIMKKERAFTSFEKVMRVSLVIFLTILSLGLCLLNKDVRRLWTDDRKVVKVAVRVIIPNSQQDEAGQKSPAIKLKDSKRFI
jgi:hypothetical protein